MTGDTYTGPVANQTGDHNHQHNHFYGPPHTPVTWPYQVGVIPPQAQWFQHRTETDRLTQALAGGGTASKVMAGGVLTGMGGVGKTQLAAEYARTALQAAELDVLVWITASSRSAAITAYAQAGVDVLGADPGDPETAARTFMAWLEPKPQPRPCRWLVVLDDIADPADLRGWWPPASPHGRTVATTRRKDAALRAGNRGLIEIGLFTEVQALAYLTTALAARPNTEPEQHLVALANDLGNLPLALSQAAAYLIDAATSCLAYRALLADRSRSLADAAPDVLPDDQTYTVAAAWSLSIDRADTLRPVGLARSVLHLASTMDPNGIPECLLTSLPARNYFTSRRACSEGDQTAHSISSDEARAALRVLHRLSLIEHSPETDRPVVRVHQLIQRTTRDSLTSIDQADATRSAADSLVATWDDHRDNGVVLGDFLANAEAVLRNARNDLWNPEPHALLNTFGANLGADCQFDAAIDYFHQLTETANHRLGADSRHTLAIRHNLAYWKWLAGDLSGAAAALQNLLSDSQRVFGATDLLTLATRRVLANVKGAAGEKTTAVAELSEVFEDALRSLGEADPFTLDVRHNLAYWHGESGNTALAADGIRAALSIRLQGIDPERMTAEEFDALLGGITSLIEQRGRSGDGAGAADQYAELIEWIGQNANWNHNIIHSMRTSLAWWKGCSGDIPGAITDYMDLLEEESEHEAHHPNVRTLLHNLAYWRGRSGDLAEAISILSGLLEIEIQAIGPHHPDTRLTRRTLAHFHWSAGTVLKWVTR